MNQPEEFREQPKTPEQLATVLYDFSEERWKKTLIERGFITPKDDWEKFVQFDKRLEKYSLLFHHLESERIIPIEKNVAPEGFINDDVHFIINPGNALEVQNEVLSRTLSSPTMARMFILEKRVQRVVWETLKKKEGVKEQPSPSTEIGAKVLTFKPKGEKNSTPFDEEPVTTETATAEEQGLFAEKMEERIKFILADIANKYQLQIPNGWKFYFGRDILKHNPIPEEETIQSNRSLMRTAHILRGIRANFGNSKSEEPEIEFQKQVADEVQQMFKDFEDDPEGFVKAILGL